MKSYTDIDQSRKLAEILPLENADMVLLHEEPYETSDSKFDGLHQALCVPFSKYDKSWRQKYRNISYFPCWSLAALIDVLPVEVEIHRQTDEHKIYYYYVESYMKRMGKEIYLSTERHESLVDACYEMILKLQYMKGE